MTQFAEAAGTPIAYDAVGGGPDLVFLHAGIADRTMWEPQMSAFGDRYRCTAIDARGFGESALGSGPFSRRDDLAAVLDTIGASEVTLIGCSMGGGFALDFAIERPQRVAKLVLVGSAATGFEGKDDPMIGEMMPLFDEAIERGDYEAAGRLEARLWVDGKRPEGSAPRWLRDKVVEWSIPINRTDWSDVGERSVQLDPLAFHRLDEVAAPTLVIVGTEDLDVVQQGCRATAAGIAGARLVELEGTAHLPSLEVPDAFNSAVAEFLD